MSVRKALRRFRSAITGRFISAKAARLNPKTSVSERDRRRGR